MISKKHEIAKLLLAQQVIKQIEDIDSWKHGVSLTWKSIAVRLCTTETRVYRMRQIKEVFNAYQKAASELAKDVSAPGATNNTHSNAFRIARRANIINQAIRLIDGDDTSWIKGGRPTQNALSKHLGIKYFFQSSELTEAFKKAVAKYEAIDQRIESLPKTNPFTPLAEPESIQAPRDPRGRLAEFIHKAKSSPALKGVSWYSWKWQTVQLDTSNKLQRSHRSKRGLIFSNRESSDGKGSARKEKFPMVEPYLSFAKADIINYQEACNVTIGSLSQRLIAHRFLEAVFREKMNTRIATLTLSDFHLAEEAMGKSYHPKTSYMVALCLSGIAATVDKTGLSDSRIGYKVRLKEPNRGDGLSEEDQAVGMAKMVSPEIMAEIAKISANPPDDYTKRIIRITDLLVICGFRIGEVLTLPVDCWREDTDVEIYTNPATGQKINPCFIVYAAEKVAEYRSKHISPSAIEVARRAINDLTELCRPAREMARWMEEHPGRVKPLADLDPNDRISGPDACKRLGFCRDANSAWPIPWLKIKSSPRHPRTYRVGDIELWLLKKGGPCEVLRLPSGSTVKLSAALLVVFHRGHPWLPYPLKLESFQSALSPSDSHRAHGMQGILPKKFRVTTHQFRHWLNTLADAGGLSETDIAYFFGRKSVSQNIVYKHGTVVQRKEAFRELIKQGQVYGRIGRISRSLSGIDLENFLEAAVGNVHITPFGVCVHDFAALPCGHHHQCFECGEYMRCRGDLESRNTLLAMRKLEIASLEISQRNLIEAGNGFSYAEKWVEASKKKIAGIEAALAIDDLPPDGDDLSAPKQILPGAKSLFTPLLQL